MSMLPGKFTLCFWFGVYVKESCGCLLIKCKSAEKLDFFVFLCADFLCLQQFDGIREY